VPRWRSADNCGRRRTSLGSALQRGLSSEGYLVDLAVDGVMGLDAARTGAYDAVILDIMLPGCPATASCEHYR